MTDMDSLPDEVWLQRSAEHFGHDAAQIRGRQYACGRGLMVRPMHPAKRGRPIGKAGDIRKFEIHDDPDERLWAHND
ncbi:MULTISPECIES: hypothetical protein [Sphingobium]|uniref:hypothetical protein n=1 Tax=Sphingobium TaxID=165695 RepID=UPI00159CA81E|nr:hypothetical protein [Sphingobium sp. 15-1]